MPEAPLPVTGVRVGAPAGGRLAALLLAAGSALLLVGSTPAAAHGDEPAHSAELDAMIVRAAKRHGVPERLLRRIVMRESKYNPHARNHRYWGLMQISYPTARSMGFRGSPEELLNPLTNLTYAVPYLANAFIAAGRSEEAAVRLYASGYYDTARRRGLLGLLRTADSTPVVNAPEPAAPQAAGAEGGSLFGSLFGSAEPTAAAPPVAAATQVGTTPPVAAQQAAGVPMLAAQDAAPRAGALPEGKATRGGTLLALDRSGHRRPPAKWMHDGGLTVLAKGEQGDGSFAATRLAAAPDAGRSRKNPVFASLDAPGARPNSAQAYTASASDEAAPPQAAISQALAAPAAPSAASPTGETAEHPERKRKAGDGEPSHRKHHHHAHHHAKPGRDDDAKS